MTHWIHFVSVSFARTEISVERLFKNAPHLVQRDFGGVGDMSDVRSDVCDVSDVSDVREDVCDVDVGDVSDVSDVCDDCE